MLRDSRKTRLNLARFQSFKSGIFLTLNTFCWMFNLELNRNVWNLLFYESHVVVITNFNKYGNIFCLQLHTIKWKRCMKQLHVWRDIINIEPMSVIAYLINLLKNNITIKCNMNSSSERCKCFFSYRKWLNVFDIYLATEGEECADYLSNVFFLPKVYGLEYINIWDTISFDSRLEAVNKTYNVTIGLQVDQ